MKKLYLSIYLFVSLSIYLSKKNIYIYIHTYTLVDHHAPMRPLSRFSDPPLDPDLQVLRDMLHEDVAVEFTWHIFHTVMAGNTT